MKNVIYDAASLKAETSRLRREFHKYPECAFCEFRTASEIIEYLSDLGYEVQYGKDVVCESALLGVPDENVLQAAKERAVADGMPAKYAESLDRGATAVVATIKGASDGGKTVAFRFDIDCNELSESQSQDHRPYAEGFSSVHDGCAHSCGHDGHIAIGLSLADLLSKNKALLRGRVKLIFQPAEEGVRGAKAMVEAGVVDDVDYFFSGHLGVTADRSGVLCTTTGGFLCAAKFDAEFFGKSAHAGVEPEEGRNALLAAAQAAIGLHAISRHGAGASRINVGVISGGTGRNVIPERAKIMFETRGATDEINSYMCSRAETVVKASAIMHDVEYKLLCVGYAGSFIPDPEFARELAEFADSLEIYREIHEYGDIRASEDCTAFLNRVKERGGKASYFLFGSDLADKHHTPRFDFDENSMADAVAFLAELAVKYSK